MTVLPVRDYTPYLKYAREQAARRRADPHIAARRERAWEVARQIADFLRREYKPTRIVAFGSIVQPEMFGLHSDIDIAVDGIPWPEYLRAWNAVEERWPEFKVDLIDVGIVSKEMCEWIDEEGQAL
jgi:predicted nucleotidyltransferase